MSKWTEEAIIAEAANYKNRTEFAKGKRNAYDASVELGILDKLFGPAPAMSGAELFSIVESRVNWLLSHSEHEAVSQAAFTFWAKCQYAFTEFYGKRDEYEETRTKVESILGLPWSLIASEHGLSPTLLPYWLTKEEEEAARAALYADRKAAAEARAKLIAD